MTNQEGVGEQDISILHLKEGDPEAYKVLFFQYYPEFFSFADMLLQDRVSAKSVTMEALFLLWKKHAGFDNEKDIKTFLYLTVRNRCLNFIRYLQQNPEAGYYRPAGITASPLPNAILQDIYHYIEREP
jgi:DNA-directed RNA polymerase specialized sigma24 family protein